MSHFRPCDYTFDNSCFLKGHCHEDFVVLGQFCAKIITLRLNLFKINRCASPFCECGLDTESVKHFFLFCPRYAAQRNLLHSNILGETWSSSSDAKKRLNFLLYGVKSAN